MNLIATDSVTLNIIIASTLCRNHTSYLSFFPAKRCRHFFTFTETKTDQNEKAETTGTNYRRRVHGGA